MCEWDIEVMKKMTEIGLKILLYMRYKDDVNVILDMENLMGRDLNGGNLDKLAMSEVKPLADSVDESLNVSTDCGSNHRDGKTPILDVKVWIEEVQPNVSKSST